MKLDDADHDILLALDRWVTQGVAPDKIIASGKIARYALKTLAG